MWKSTHFSRKPVADIERAMEPHKLPHLFTTTEAERWGRGERVSCSLQLEWGGTITNVISTKVQGNQIQTNEASGVPTHTSARSQRRSNLQYNYLEGICLLHFRGCLQDASFQGVSSRPLTLSILKFSYPYVRQDCGDQGLITKPALHHQNLLSLLELENPRKEFYAFPHLPSPTPPPQSSLRSLPMLCLDVGVFWMSSPHCPSHCLPLEFSPVSLVSFDNVFWGVWWGRSYCVALGSLELTEILLTPPPHAKAGFWRCLNYGWHFSDSFKFFP